MHTAEQAKDLWCPMARVAQTGNTDTHSAYNRTLKKQHYPMEVAVVQNPDDFELGEAPTPTKRIEHVLATTAAPSMAAKCLADGCAMWRWHPTTSPHPDTGTLTMNGPGGITDRMPAKGNCGLANGGPA